MKAIETEFDGYKFRSRLEARWAVFFRMAGIPFEYEPEGYELPSGKYLPDFYLPWFKCYVEIKPNEPDAIAKGEKCCKELRDNLEDGITMLCIGDPADDNIRLYCYVYDDSGGGPYEYNKAYFVEGASWMYTENGTIVFGEENTKHRISIMVNEPRTDRRICTNCGKWCCAESIWTSEPPCDDDEMVTDMYLLTGCRSEFCYAKYRARKARFEHGADPLEKNYDDWKQALPFSLGFWKFIATAKSPVNTIRYHKITDREFDINDDWEERLQEMRMI